MTNTGHLNFIITPMAPLIKPSETDIFHLNIPLESIDNFIVCRSLVLLL